MGRDDKDCRILELMRERTSDTYKVKEEMMALKYAPYFNQVPPLFNPSQPQYNNAQQPHYNNAQ